MNVELKSKVQKVQRPVKFNFIVIFLITILAFVLFWDKSLDIAAAKIFYHPDNLQDPWFEQNYSIWNFFYRSAPWLTGILLLGSLGFLLISSFKQSLQKFRRHSVFIFLAVALGPGLFVNSIFKPYWGRPRPREVIELGGKYNYQPFYKANIGGQGKAFPCGHCSVGFVYMAFWLLLREKRKKLASGFLVGSLVLGGLLGAARMSAGGHFLSDVIGSFVIVWAVTCWLYYFGLKIPQAESGEIGGVNTDSKISQLMSRRWMQISVYSVLGVGTVLMLLLASPFYSEIKLGSGGFKKLQNLDFRIARGDVELILEQNMTEPFSLEGYAKGFGFPGNKVLQKCNAVDAEKLNCEITANGFFSDYESVIRLKINPGKIENLNLSIEKGDVDTARAGALPANYKIHTLLGL